MDSLKPCPRHGTAPVYDHTKCDGVRFSCNACDEDTFDDFEDAAAAWNTRSEGLPPPGGGGNEGNQGDMTSHPQPLEGRGDPCPALSADAVPPGLTLSFAELEDLHSAVAQVITANERYVPDEEYRWGHLGDWLTRLAIACNESFPAHWKGLPATPNLSGPQRSEAALSATEAKQS